MKSRIPPIKLIACCLLLALWGAPELARAQYYVNNQASTVGESRARGMSDVIRSQGEYNLATSAAAINLTQARSQDIVNRQAGCQAYFEMRKMNREYRAAEKEAIAHPPRAAEAMTRYAQQGKPRKVSPGELDPVTGRIAWPSLLKANEHEENREALDKLFAKRAYDGAISTDEKTQLRKAVMAMLDDLKKQRRLASPTDYNATTDFLRSLAYEGQSPVT